MGSIVSAPKVPASQPVIQYVSAPVSAASAAVDSGNSAQSSDVPQNESEAREQNLLRRSRGRLGTILTGFRGVLAPSSISAKKTLLGE